MIEHLRGRDRKLEPLGWTGQDAEWIALAVMAQITTSLPAAPEFQNQQAFEQVFGFVPRALAASLVAYWCGEFANAFVMSKMKVWTGGKYLWTRTVGSTVVGQLIDTVVVITVIFIGIHSFSTMLNLMFTGYFAKVIYEARRDSAYLLGGQFAQASRGSRRV